MSQCRATAKATGKQCQKPAMSGGLVCRSHGGGAPQTRAAAAVRVAEADALATMANMTITPVDDPLFELSKLAGEALAWRDLLRARVAELTSLGYQGPTGEQIRAAVALYGASMDRLERVLVSIGRLKIDERLAAISERQAEVVIAAIDAGLDAANLTMSTRHVIRSRVARHLEAVRRIS